MLTLETFQSNFLSYVILAGPNISVEKSQIFFFFSWTKTVTFFPEWVWVMTSRTCTQAVDKFSLNVCCVVGYSDSDFSLFSFGEFWHNSFNTRATAATLLQMPKYL